MALLIGMYLYLPEFLQGTEATWITGVSNHSSNRKDWQRQDSLVAVCVTERLGGSLVSFFCPCACSPSSQRGSPLPWVSEGLLTPQQLQLAPLGHELQMSTGSPTVATAYSARTCLC